MRSCNWNTHIFHSDDVTVENWKIMATRSDGINTDNSRNVSINNLFVNSHDDSACVKSTNFLGVADTVGNYTLKNAVLGTVKCAVKIGTETNADTISNINYENVTVYDSREAFAIRFYDRSAISNINYKNIEIFNSGRSFLYTMADGRAKEATVDDVTIDTVKVHGPDTVIMFDGEIGNVNFINYELDGKIITSEAVANMENNSTANITFSTQ